MASDRSPPGCTAITSDVEAGTSSEALRKADQRMYAQKSSGRRSADRQSKDVLLRALADELDRLLGTGKFVAIGESMPYMPAPWDKTALVSRVDAIANIMRIVEVAQQHGVAFADVVE